MKTVIQGDYALIGYKRALAALSPEDIAVLSVPAEVDEPEITVLVQHIVQIYRDEVDVLESQMLSEMLADKDLDGDMSPDAIRQITRALMLLITECDRIIIRGRVRGKLAQVSARVAFAKNSRLAAFARAQTPVDHTLLGALPATPAGMLVVGTLHAGPFRATMSEFLVDIARTTVSEVAAGSMHAWLELLTGSAIMNINVDTTREQPSVTMLEVSDPGAVMRHSRTFTTNQKDITFTPRAFQYQGVDVDREISTDSDTAGQVTLVAAVGPYYLMTEGPKPDASMRAAIDAVRGKGKALEPSAPMKAAVSRSRARNDSLLMVVPAADLGASLQWLPASTRTVAFGLAFGPSSAVFTLELVEQ